MIKDKIIEFGNLYEEIRKEVLRIIEEIKLKVRDIADAQIVQSLKEKRDFYWKHDLPTIKGLANRYRIKISKLNELWEKYIDIEQNMLKNKEEFEKVGLKDIDFGPKTISASGERNSKIYIYINNQKQCLDININSESDEAWTEDFEKFADDLKDRILEFLQKNEKF